MVWTTGKAEALSAAAVAGKATVLTSDATFVESAAANACAGTAANAAVSECWQIQVVKMPPGWERPKISA